MGLIDLLYQLTARDESSPLIEVIQRQTPAGGISGIPGTQSWNAFTVPADKLFLPLALHVNQSSSATTFPTRFQLVQLNSAGQNGTIIAAYDVTTETTGSLAVNSTIFKSLQFTDFIVPSSSQLRLDCIWSGATATSQGFLAQLYGIQIPRGTVSGFS